MLEPLPGPSFRGFALFALLPVLVSVGCSLGGSHSSGDPSSPLGPSKVGSGDVASGGFPGGAGGADATSSGRGSSSGSGSGSSSSGMGQGGSCGADVMAPDETLPDTTDPAKGVFTLDEALAELPDGPGPLRAILETDVGSLSCELRPDKTANGVANFVGLARGRRPWLDPATNKWVKRRFYDGLLFHDIDATQKVIFSGDPLGTGLGGPGYTFVGDIVTDLQHVPGTLGYTEVKGVDGSQFYITAAALPTEDGKDTIFGLCAPVSVVSELLAMWKAPPNIKLKSVTITRCAP